MWTDRLPPDVSCRYDHPFCPPWGASPVRPPICYVGAYLCTSARALPPLSSPSSRALQGCTPALPPSTPPRQPDLSGSVARTACPTPSSTFLPPDSVASPKATLDRLGLNPQPVPFLLLGCTWHSTGRGRYWGTVCVKSSRAGVSHSHPRPSVNPTESLHGPCPMLETGNSRPV